MSLFVALLLNNLGEACDLKDHYIDVLRRETGGFDTATVGVTLVMKQILLMTIIQNYGNTELEVLGGIEL